MKKIQLYTFLIMALLLGLMTSVQAEEGLKPKKYASYLQKDSQYRYGEGTVTTVPSYTMTLNGQDHDKQELNLNEGDSIAFKVPKIEKGNYALLIEYQVLGKGLSPLQFDLRINGSYPFKEAESLRLPVYYQNETSQFEHNKAGHEILPKQIKLDSWQKEYLKDPNGRLFSPYEWLLEDNDHISLSILSGQLKIKEISLVSSKHLKHYQAVDQSFEKGEDVKIVIPAEKNFSKNSLQAKQIVSRDLKVSPYETHHHLLNAFESSNPGEKITYQFEVKDPGFYALGFHVLQSKQKDHIYRNIYIDDQIPFSEAVSFPFKGDSQWHLQVFGEKEPYWIYLDKGIHTLSLEASSEPYYFLMTALEDISDELNTLNLELKKLLGNETDRYRDWDMTNYMPNLTTNLMDMREQIAAEKETLLKTHVASSKSEIIQKTDQIIHLFDKVLEDPNEIPKKMNLLSEGSGSIAQLSADLLEKMNDQSLVVDEIYFVKDTQAFPTRQVGFFKKISETLKRFAVSFRKPKVEDKAKLQVWVNRNRNIVEVLETFVTEDFTQQTGIEVEISVMPDEQKLILSNASKVQPDVALGISTNMPYEFAIRNAALDLKSMPQFSQVTQRFSPGAMISYVKDEGVYALPETQDFYVTFYRTDIFEALNLQVPNTWDDLKKLLPELQRYGMNFYIPLASSSGMKPFMFTAPFIYQNGGRIYDPQTMHVALDEYEAMQGFKMMTDLFSIDGLPVQVANFYHAFRYGDIPIGISNLADYQKLITAAPEIAGRWDIALHPGVESQGEIKRYATGSAQASMIFSDTQYPEEAWEFLQWWTSTETQTEFSHRLLNLYGYEYLWASANLEAFSSLPIKTSHKKTILEQWEWLFEVPKVPGGYMVEREMSNVWNKNIFEGENLRASLDEAIVKMNRELDRKLEEFSYKKDGQIIKEYAMPSIKEIERWGLDED